ncbi:MAG: Ig-like domain-containing protein [Gemmatimonadaceae bacterium]|nr:Ig-like domain-containing protein [Gemmatimonadaceae bacterium]
MMDRASRSIVVIVVGAMGATASSIHQPDVATLSVTPDSVLLAVPRREPLTAIARDRDGAVVRGTIVRWASSDATVATVAPTGMLSAVGPGEARIIARAGSVADTIHVSVVPRSGGRIARVSILPASATLAVGETITLTGAAFTANGQPSTQEAPLWNTDNPLVAAVTSSGRVRGLAPGTARLTMSAGGATSSVRVTVTGATRNEITVDTTTTFQTMTGWQGAGQNGWFECDRLAFSLYKDQLHDRLVNELGIERVTIALRSGTENTKDYHAEFAAGRISSAEYRRSWSAPVNDNEDPMVSDSSRFQWSFLDGFMEQAVLPLRERLAARGERLQLVLTYVDFEREGYQPGGLRHMKQPAEYAELVTMAFVHLQQKYGIVPDAFELVLEPEHTPYSAADIGRSMVALVARLRAAGFAPTIIAPSTTSVYNAAAFYDQILQVPGTTGLIGELSYHRYVAEAYPAVDAIGQRWLRDGVKTAMLEHIGADFEELYEDLVVANASSWMQFANGFCGRRDNPAARGAYYQINQSDPAHPRVNFTNESKRFRQVFAYVRRGAVRVGATSGNPTDILPLAFRNANGRMVAIVWAKTAATFSVSGLPAGAYGLNFSTAGAQWNVDRPDQQVDAGGSVRASLPAGGVMTIYQR